MPNGSNGAGHRVVGADAESRPDGEITWVDLATDRIGGSDDSLVELLNALTARKIQIGVSHDRSRGFA